jgi:hypothetical protein
MYNDKTKGEGILIGNLDEIKWKSHLLGKVQNELGNGRAVA